MPSLNTAGITVNKVFEWCSDAFSRCGRKLVLPRGTDPLKTYHWRYATRLAKNFEEWEFDDATAKAFIRVAVGYLRERNLLSKGINAFFQGNLLQTCLDKLTKESEINDRHIARLASSKEFLAKRSIGISPVKILLYRPSFDRSANIVEWYNNGTLSRLFLATSRSCTAALSMLNVTNAEQRNELPNSAALYSLWRNVIAEPELKQRVISVLGDDWRELCTQ